MYVPNRVASLIFKIVILAVCLISVLLNTGIFFGLFYPYVFLYYTIVSNIFCFIYYLVATIFTAVTIGKTGPRGAVRFTPHFKGAVVMSMVLASLIYAFILADFSAGIIPTVSGLLAHVVLPILVLMDWVLFDRKGKFMATDPLIWLVIPFSYYCIVLLAAQFGVVYSGGVHYPYRFMNPEIILWAPVLVNTVLICLGYYAIGNILLGVDRLLGNQARKKVLLQAAALAEQTAYAPNSAASPEANAAPPEALQSLQDMLNNKGAATGVGLAAGAGVAMASATVGTKVNAGVEPNVGDAIGTSAVMGNADYTLPQQPPAQTTSPQSQPQRQVVPQSVKRTTYVRGMNSSAQPAPMPYSTPSAAPVTPPSPVQASTPVAGTAATPYASSSAYVPPAPTISPMYSVPESTAIPPVSTGTPYYSPPSNSTYPPPSTGAPKST